MVGPIDCVPIGNNGWKYFTSWNVIVISRAKSSWEEAQWSPKMLKRKRHVVFLESFPFGFNCSHKQRTFFFFFFFWGAEQIYNKWAIAVQHMLETKEEEESSSLNWALNLNHAYIKNNFLYFFSNYTQGLTPRHQFLCETEYKYICFFGALSNRVCKMSNLHTASRGCGFRQSCKTVGLWADLWGPHVFPCTISKHIPCYNFPTESH